MPSSLLTAFSTRDEQAEQLMPVMLNFSCFNGLTPLFHEFLKGADEFIDDFVFAFTDVVDDAGLDMLAQEFLIERIQCRLDGTDLSQDINAVAVVFDHLSHTPYLALDAVQAGNERFILFALFVAILMFLRIAAGTDFLFVHN
jgi:hypothetical protein